MARAASMLFSLIGNASRGGAGKGFLLGWEIWQMLGCNLFLQKRL